MKHMEPALVDALALVIKSGLAGDVATVLCRVYEMGYKAGYAVSDSVKNNELQMQRLGQQQQR